MTNKTQPDALELHEELWFAGNRPSTLDEELDSWSKSAEHIIRRQHAEIQQLKAQLSARQAAPDWIEDLAQSWDECMYDAPGEMIDIGASIRKAASRAAPPPPEREPLTDEQIEAAYKNLQVRRNKEQDEAFQAGIGKSCMHCSEGHYQADWNGYSTFHRCDKCRHVPFDLSGLVKKSAASCWCETCRPVTLSDMRMVLCPDCHRQ